MNYYRTFSYICLIIYFLNNILLDGFHLVILQNYYLLIITYWYSSILKSIIWSNNSTSSVSTKLVLFSFFQQNILLCQNFENCILLFFIHKINFLYSPGFSIFLIFSISLLSWSLNWSSGASVLIDNCWVSEFKTFKTLLVFSFDPFLF